MKNLSLKCNNVEHSKIRKMFNLAAEMDNCINFSVGEPDFNTPQNIIEAGRKALAEGKTKYTLNAGIVPLRQAIADSAKRDYGFDVNPEKEIIVTAGGSHALNLAMLVMLDPGDEIILPEPYWTNHPEQVKICGAIPKFVPVREEDGFVYNIHELEKAVSSKTKAILINSPSNPTGAVIDRNKLEEIAEFTLLNDLYIISDDVYYKLIYDGGEFTSITSIKGMRDRTVIVNSFSKSYAMTGWRIGYAIAPEKITGEMVKFEENVVSCINTPSQYAAIEALTGDQSCIMDMVAQYENRRNIIIKGLNSIPKISAIKPKGAFYAFANIKETGLSSWDFAIRLLKEKGVVTVPGTAFGDAGEGFIRISYASSLENIYQGLQRMNDFIKSC